MALRARHHRVLRGATHAVLSLAAVLSAHCASAQRVTTQASVPPIAHEVPREDVRPTAPSTVMSGIDWSCAITPARTVACWGGRIFGPGGVHFIAHDTPAIVQHLHDVVSLDDGLALRADGTLWSWEGRGAHPEHAYDSSTAEQYPRFQQVLGVSRIVDMDAIDTHACAVDEEGALYCWDGVSGPARRVARMPALARVTVGNVETCVLTRDGRVGCWPRSPTGAEVTSHWMDELVDAVEIAAGGAQTCARSRRGALACWGGFYAFDRGRRTHAREREPVVEVTEAGVVTGLALSDHGLSCALHANGALTCWRAVSREQDASEIMPATLFPGTGQPLVQLASGARHLCGQQDNGHVVCWGENQAGQLGHDGDFAVPMNSAVTVATSETHAP